MSKELKYVIGTGLAYGFFCGGVLCVLMTGYIIAELKDGPWWKLLVGSQISMWLGVLWMYIAVKIKHWRDGL